MIGSKRQRRNAGKTAFEDRTETRNWAAGGAVPASDPIMQLQAAADARKDQSLADLSAKAASFTASDPIMQLQAAANARKDQSLADLSAKAASLTGGPTVIQRNETYILNLRESPDALRLAVEQFIAASSLNGAVQDRIMTIYAEKAKAANNPFTTVQVYLEDLVAQASATVGEAAAAKPDKPTNPFADRTATTTTTSSGSGTTREPTPPLLEPPPASDRSRRRRRQADGFTELAIRHRQTAATAATGPEDMSATMAARNAGARSPRDWPWVPDDFEAKNRGVGGGEDMIPMDEFGHYDGSRPIRKRWKSDPLGKDASKEDYLNRVDRYLKHVRTLSVEEAGGSELPDTAPDWLRDAPVHEEDVTDRTGLLREVVNDEELAERAKNVEDETTSPAWIRKMIKKVYDKALAKYPNAKDAIVFTAVRTEAELGALIEEHKDWKSVARKLGGEGVAGYLEQMILPAVMDSLDTNIKEMVPWSGNRKKRDKAAGVGEGLLDMGYNAAGLAAETSTFGAAAPFLGVIGGGYKGALARLGAKRSGSSDRKANAIGAVTLILEAAQGSIPFYGGVVGVTGGARSIYKKSELGKYIERGRYGYSKRSGPGGGDPRILEILPERITEGQRLLEEGAKFEKRSKKKVKKARAKLDKMIDFLIRQTDKSEKRFGKAQDKGTAPLLKHAT